MLDLNQITCCPRCLSALELNPHKPVCTNQTCEYSQVGFPMWGGQPVLVDFARSVFDRSSYDHASTDIVPTRTRFAGSVRMASAPSLKSRLRELILGRNRLALKHSVAMLEALKARSATPCLLIIGGGAIGSGVDHIYQDPSVDVVAIDVYPSPQTCLLGDAHHLPFRDETFDGVWIQAVLEHVLEPHVVVEQIHRVLKSDGVVYAETPFMQQVHEGPHDFTRFTLSGHRWLFRRFSQISGGVLGGAGWSMVWAIRYFWEGLGVGTRGAILLTAPFFWLRYFDRFMRGRGHIDADGALGFFFFGRKAEKALSPKEIIAYYQTE